LIIKEKVHFLTKWYTEVMKNILIPLLVLAAIGGGVYMFLKKPSLPVTPAVTTTNATTTQTQETVPQVKPDTTQTILGTSVSGNNITAYHFGNGTDELLFIGGIHGGYEWNTSLVAYQLMDYLKANPTSIPKNLKVTVIPVLNPDGLSKVVGTSTERFAASDVSTIESVVISGRFNANNVDLNRNFDCDWKAKATWQTKTVSGGTAAFSEPESQAIKNYVEKNTPTAVVVWYSSGGGVFASSCHNGVSKETNKITKVFADASGYTAHQSFDFYATTGDMVNWLAKQSIPAISILLTTHNDTEWTKNQAGIEALLKYYAK